MGDDRAARNIMRHGRPENPPETVPLAAGPLTCDYVAGDLRNIRLGEQEIIRCVYVAVRDRYWNTIPATLDDVRITANSDSFAIRYRATHRQGNICFRWEATITGDASGEIVFAMDGEACSTFLRNRIGICVLHPYTCASAVMVQRKMDNRLLSLSDNQNGPLVFELQLATRLLSGSTCRS